MKTLFHAALAVALLSGGAQAAGDAANGEKVFARNCKACHEIVTPDGKEIVKGGKVGPDQYGLINRHAATAPGFTRYSESLKAAGAKGLVWTEEEVAKFVEDPKKYLAEYLGDPTAKSNMAFKLRKAEDRADVAAYLASVGG